MNRSLDRSRLPRLRHRILLAGLLSIGVLAAPTKGAAFSGVANDLPVSALTGWTQCYLDTYDNTGLTTAGVLGACTKDQLMLACRATGASVLNVAAHAARADVTFDTGTSDVPNVANGVGWYFNDDFAWGFAPAADTIDLNICDISSTNPDTRLCWHTQQAPALGGWRCGADTSLNSSPSFERVVYEADTDPNTCTTADDADGDGVCDASDNCPATINHDQTDSDTDTDTIGDACDTCSLDADNDIDADTICGDVDNCALVANTDQANADGDSEGDACDTCTDSDLDGFGDPGSTSCTVDNCPADVNVDQGDLDGDTAGDVCDADDAGGLSITKLRLKKSSRPTSDTWTSAGTLDASASPTFSADVLGGGLAVAVRAQGGGLVDADSFAALDCKTVGQANLKCSNASRSSVRLTKRSDGTYRVAITVRKASFASLPVVPADVPFSVTLTSPVSIDRNDAVPAPGSCTSTASAVSCKE